ncbi:MAG: hypothetical protein WCJ29_05080 [bacterium]
METFPEIFSEPTAFGAYSVAFAALILLVLFALKKWHRTSPRILKLEKALIFPFHARQIFGAMIGSLLICQTPILDGTPLGTAYKVVSMLIGLGFIFFEHFYFELAIAGIALYLLTLINLGFVFTPLAFIPGAMIFLGATSPRTWFKQPIPMHERQTAYTIFRICFGLTFLTTAYFTWRDPSSFLMIANFLAPKLNGLGLDQWMITFWLMLLEVAIGLAYLFNLFIRPISMLLFPIFAIIIWFAGVTSLIAILPIMAALATFAMYGHTYTPKYKTHLEIHGPTTQISDKLPV